MRKKRGASGSYPWEDDARYGKGSQASIWGTFLVSLGAIAIAIAFNARGLAAWADGLEDPLAREAAMTVVEIATFPFAPLAPPGDATRAWFLSFARPEDAAPSGSAEPEILFAAASGGALVASVESAGGPGSPDAATPVTGSALASRPSGAGSAPAAAPRLSVIEDVATATRHRAPEGSYSAERPLRILFVGDSLAQLSTSDALIAWDKATPWAEVTISTKISSSLTNPRVMDWHAQIRKLTECAAYDCVIAMIGSNDAQGISAGKKSYYFDTPEWYQSYDERFYDFAGVMADRAWKVYWTGIPPMRSESYGNRVAKLQSHLRGLVSAIPNARFVDLAPIVGDAKGLYASTRVIDGKQRVIRNVDGVHMDYYGGVLIVREWERLLRMDFAILVPGGQAAPDAVGSK